MKTTWDYTFLAKPYLTRPDYAPSAINEMLAKSQTTKGKKVCDVGAGVAHLTIPLMERGLDVIAVEPNDAMRELGSQRSNLIGKVTWIEGTGEETKQPSSTYDLVTFGSSFNVTDRQKALVETSRILKSEGWFACMWNHRDLEDPIQKAVENIIRKHIPNYDYGSRREDQTEIIEKSGLFKRPHFFEGSVQHKVNRTDWVDAWRSHATLARQAGENFGKIVDEIESYINKEVPGDSFIIPYTTRIWLSQRINPS